MGYRCSECEMNLTKCEMNLTKRDDSHIKYNAQLRHDGHTINVGQN